MPAAAIVLATGRGATNDGVVHGDVGRRPLALREACDAFESAGDILVARAKYDASSPLIRLGRPDEARAHLDAALAVFEAQGDQRVTSGALAALSWIERLAGDVAAAIETARRAVDAARAPPVSAREAVLEAAAIVRECAECIGDAALRTSFVAHVEENRRTLALADAWR